MYFSLTHKRHPLSTVNYFPAFVPLIIAAVVGAGIVEGISSLSSASHDHPPALPPAPSIDQAGATALDAQTKQRQAALAAGSQTNVTGGSGIILGQDVNSVTLVGAG